MGLVSQINKTNFNLIHASVNQMNKIGTVIIEIKPEKLKPNLHEFKVRNSKTSDNVLLGRDSMKRFGLV